MCPLHEMTPEEYREHLIQTRVDEYSCTREEAGYDLTKDKVEQSHSELVSKAADAGIIISERVLDAMGRARFNVLKWHAEAYSWYLPPEIREKK